MGKRIFYFLLTNVLVLVTISIILSLTGGWNYIGQNGIDYGALLIFSAVVGFTGSFISLAISRWMAKRMMGVRVINPDAPRSDYERAVVEKVHRLARTAGLMHMPERSEEHTSELQSRGHLVCRLLLEKKKKHTQRQT